MTNEARFFDAVRAGKLLGPVLSPEEVSGCSAILAAMASSPIAFAAYALATAYKETAHTMQPIGEFGGDSYFFRRYDPKGNRPDIARQLGNTEAGDGVRFHGRGLVQLTGRANYTKASPKVGVDLVAYPDRALEPEIAASIMRHGMAEGWFVPGSRFAAYLPPTGLATAAQFIAARRIINGQDCAGEIADAAMQFQAALVAGGWA